MTGRGVTHPVIRHPLGRMTMVAASLVILGGVSVEAHAQGGTLDAPMHPIGKSDGTPSRCAKCPAAEIKDVDAQRVTERSAPEYPGARGPGPEMDPSENSGGGLSGAQLPIALPLR